VKDLLRVIIVLLKWLRKVEGSRRVTLAVIAGGALAGLGSSALIAVVNAALAAQSSKVLLVAFLALCIAVPIFGYFSEALLIRYTSQVVYNLQLRLAGQILTGPYRLLEELGAHRLLATITDDINSISVAATNFPVLLTQCFIMAGCLIYLGWLSLPLLGVVLAYMAVGLMAYYVPLKKSTKLFRLARGERDTFFRHIRALIEGIKELKLNRRQREGFMEQQFERAAGSVQEYSSQANTLSAVAAHCGQALFVILLGLLVFFSPRMVAIDSHILTGYAFTILFMISPLITILNTVPLFTRAGVAAEKIEALGLSFSKYPGEPTSEEQPFVFWNKLELVAVTHAYCRSPEVSEFCLGPLDLTFRPGELVFLVGGNGSGKTTLAKLIVGLYEPLNGEMRLDGRTVTLANRDHYRQCFSAVFSDFYLFDHLYSLSAQELAAKAPDYIKMLQLHEKVTIDGNKLSTVDLSQGQRKRLALLTAYLEDRPIYVFDEWAADQDPIFKEVFYHQILPQLKARKKTVLVISHDDRYYHVADRLIRLERGVLEEGLPVNIQQREISTSV
jgi:putative ATP-binding cassette transporter